MAIRVLLVDDVEDLRALFRVQLDADPRFEVVGEAGNGRDAIELASETRPDVIMLDVAMPVMDGVAAIPHLHRAAPGTRILMVSGFDAPSIIEQALATCASSFIEKGTSLRDLLAEVERVHELPPKECVPVPA